MSLADQLPLPFDDCLAAWARGELCNCERCTFERDDFDGSRAIWDRR